MLKDLVPPSEIRKAFKKNLASGRLQRLPGVFSPLTALLAQSYGFEGLYLSGATLSAEMALPDIGLTTQTELCIRARSLCQTTSLPVIADMDTGFGESVQVARSVREAEQSGLTGIHLEDQMNIKRCGHLDHKTLIPTDEMIHKIRSAVEVRTDPNFLIIVRTDARGPEGLNRAIERTKRYTEAGADGIFPEALKSADEFETFRKNISLPLLANMTEFGKSPLLDVKTLEQLGYNMVIWPVTLLRLALKAMEQGLSTLKEAGHQQSLIPSMFTRKELYELLQYDEYQKFDHDIANFSL